ncbi:MAG: TPM domain-containing protein [Ginsengibacter sp.]
MWPFSKKKDFFSKEDNELIVRSIRDAERKTSGEVRVFVESRCRFIDALDRAVEIFAELKMQNTAQRNAVLVYVAIKDRQLAVYGDTGIHQKTGEEYWKTAINNMLLHFNRENYADGIATCVTMIGKALQDHFPFDADLDKNELPDEIIFGK